MNTPGKPTRLKFIGLFSVAVTLGMAATGFVRYQAKALESQSQSQSRLILLPQSLWGKEEALDQTYRFSMEVVGGPDLLLGPSVHSPRLIRLELVADRDQFFSVATVREATASHTLKTFRQPLAQATFESIWQQLRALEVAELTDLSPHSEQGVKQALAKSPAPAVAPSFSGLSNPGQAGTYRFTFQDGRGDYPNSFEVFAPSHLEDQRYARLKAFAQQLAEDTYRGAI